MRFTYIWAHMCNYLYLELTQICSHFHHILHIQTVYTFHQHWPTLGNRQDIFHFWLVENMEKDYVDRPSHIPPLTCCLSEKNNWSLILLVSIVIFSRNLLIALYSLFHPSIISLSNSTSPIIIGLTSHIYSYVHISQIFKVFICIVRNNYCYCEIKGCRQNI